MAISYKGQVVDRPPLRVLADRPFLFLFGIGPAAAGEGCCRDMHNEAGGDGAARAGAGYDEYRR